MDDLERKLFLQLDDDTLDQRRNALEVLHEHLQKQKRSFRDIIREFDDAAVTSAT